MSEHCNHSHSHSHSGGCNTCNSSSCSGKKAPEAEKIPLREGATVKKVIAVVSGKGGVGKSLVTASMAAKMQKSGLRTAVLDADITGPSMPRVFGISGKAGGTKGAIKPALSSGGIQVISLNLLLKNDTDPVAWRSNVITNAVKQFWSEVIWEDVDVMFIDMPPGTGDVPLTVFQSLPVDGIVIVTSPQELVTMIVEKAVKLASIMKVPVLGIVENMAYFTCPDCDKKHTIFGESQAMKLAQQYNIRCVEQIPIDPTIATHCDKGEIEKLDTPWLEDIAEEISDILDN